MTSTQSTKGHRSKVGTDSKVKSIQLNTLFKEEIYTIDSQAVRLLLEKILPELFQEKEKGKNVEFVLNRLQNDPKKNVSLSFAKDGHIYTFKIQALTNDQVKDYLPYITGEIALFKFFENDKDKHYGFLKKKIEEYKTQLENTEQEELHYATDFGEEPDNPMMGGRRTLTKRRQHRKSKTLKKTGARK
jgi:hypothetical protein